MPDSFNFLNLVSLNILPFLMVVTRLGVIFFMLPPFQGNGIPRTVKVLITLAMAIIVFPIVVINAIKLDIKQFNFFEIFYYIAIEFLIGLVISFVITIIFAAIEFAGHLIDFNSGFGFSAVIDPITQQNTTLTSKFYFLLGTALFFVINGHNSVINAVVESYRVLPIGLTKINLNSINYLIRSFANIFMIGFKIAAPIVITLFITEVALAVLARAIPQLNVFLVGFSLKISVLFIILAIMLINTVPYLQGLFEESFLNVRTVIHALKTN